MDMTNSSSTYLGIIAGAIIGGIVSWWIFNRQMKTSDKQDYTLSRIEQLENYNEKLERSRQSENNEKLLAKIFDLNKKLILY
jgi:Na+/glutamate symporter